jgi:hypothetical protein
MRQDNIALLTKEAQKRKEQESLRELEQALSELIKCNQNDIEFTQKFTKYHKLFKEIFPECIHEYSLKSPFGPSYS